MSPLKSNTSFPLVVNSFDKLYCLSSKKPIHFEDDLLLNSNFSWFYSVFSKCCFNTKGICTWYQDCLSIMIVFPIVSYIRSKTTISNKTIGAAGSQYKSVVIIRQLSIIFLLLHGSKMTAIPLYASTTRSSMVVCYHLANIR